MLRLDLQFYAFFMVILVGAVLGLMFDLLRVIRGYYRPNPWIGAAGDLLYWLVATAAISGGLFFGNWGQLRFYVLVGILLGVGLYYLLASPFIVGLARFVLRVLEWLADLLVTLFLRLVWGPLVWLAGLVWATAQLLWRWSSALASVLVRLLGWLLAPLNGPYRYVKLHYLLAKRRLKRWLRRWL